MWTHSQWEFVDASVEEVERLAHAQLTSASSNKINGGLVVQDWEKHELPPWSDQWSHEDGRLFIGLTAIYALDPRSLEISASPGQSIVGVASNRPAHNRSLVARISSETTGARLVPKLKRMSFLALKGLGLREARKEEAGRNISIAYIEEDTFNLEDWAGVDTFDAVTLVWEDALLAPFSRGHLMVHGVGPERFPDAVAILAANDLWIVSEREDERAGNADV